MLASEESLASPQMLQKKCSDATGVADDESKIQPTAEPVTIKSNP
jgi:hypothetical protein